ncbi:hypothetical protein BGZ73_002376 [Actinomortierella ambigua]|nr:hypothetical protein BGZ73_002376 [Actinomortierella ambigua]
MRFSALSCIVLVASILSASVVSAAPGRNCSHCSQQRAAGIAACNAKGNPPGCLAQVRFDYEECTCVCRPGCIPRK